VVRLTKIYTRTGDDGRTGLADGSRAGKDEPRVCAYGEVDEANSAVGLAVCACPEDDAGGALRATLARIQNDLFDVGADLATPRKADEREGEALRVTPEQVERLERLIDEHNEALGPLESFVLPGGSELASRLHLARAVTRRAERAACALRRAEGEGVSATPAIYLNRLSDLLFVLARVANARRGGAWGGAGDVLWKPGEGRSGEESKSEPHEPD